MATEDQVLADGRDDTSTSRGSRPVATREGGAAAGRWPDWARPQLHTAVELAHRDGNGTGLARVLYRGWFQQPVDAALAPDRPLAGLYRAAHAAGSAGTRSGCVSVLRRQDAVRAGGWWRTWGEHWTPRSSRGAVRLLMSPRPDRLADFVHLVTTALFDEPLAWSLACPLDARRLARSGSAVLDLPDVADLPAQLLAELPAVLVPVAPPLCLPLAPGIAAAGYPDSGMTFGEHRCHLLAVALRHPVATRDPLRTIARVFDAHGVDPARPYLSPA